MSGPPMDDLKVTPEEYNRLKDAMKEPEFRALLSDYMQEISDPKNKAEYDEYLKQLEKDRELPKNMKLVEPKACFCLKTKIKAKNNSKTYQKLFINICSSADIERPTQNKKESQKGKGAAWSVPYSASKIRYDQDKTKAVCSVIDVVYHPLAFEFARKNEAFKNMICEVALDAANKQIRDENDMASKDFKILKKTVCKGGKPALLPMRVDQKFTPEGNKPARPERNEDQGPKLYQEFMKQQTTQKVNEIQQKGRTRHIVELASHDFEVTDETEKKPQEEEDVKAIARPKFNFTYIQDVEIGSFIAQGLTDEHPKFKSLLITISLPKVSGIKEVNLDVSQKQLILKVPEKYYLDVALPVRVKEEEGNAKFESKTKTLKITLPIIPEDRAIPQKPQVEEVETEEKNNGEQSTQAESEAKSEKKTIAAADQEVAVKEADINPEDIESISKAAEEDNAPQFGDKSSLKFVTEESQKKFLEEREKMIAKIGEDNSGKVLVQELEQPAVQPEQKKEEEQKKEINLSKDFKTQETQGNYFFIFNVPNYKQEGAKIGFLEQEILFSYADDKREYKSWIQLDRKYDIKGSVSSFVVDYIVINLKKLEPAFWEKSSYSVKEYSSDFETKLTSYEDSLKLVESQRDGMGSENKENAEEEGEKKEEDAQGNTGMDDSKPENENKNNLGEDRNGEKLGDKRSINFINYNRNTFVFQLD